MTSQDNTHSVSLINRMYNVPEDRNFFMSIKLMNLK